jgi:peptidyl-prolyl cis-trans isomerase A (cyclophilin A)
MTRSVLLIVATFVCVASVANAGLLATVTLKTYGKLGIELYSDAAPKTVANFVELARGGFYKTGCELYRYAPNFVIQGGNLNNASNATVPLEYSIPNDKYTVGLARANAPDTGSSEFYINLANNSAMLAPSSQSGGYAVFGAIVSGFDVLATLETLPEKAEPQYGGMHMFVNPPVIEAIDITVN